MSIVIVRHGQTPLNVTRVLQTGDTPLSELGMQQAQRLSACLTDLQVTRVLCSDYLRTRMTIAPFEASGGLVAELHPELRERNFGQLCGRPYDEVPNVFASDYAPPDGETWEVFEQRVARAWALITATAEQTPGVLAVVTHGLVCFSLLRRHLQLASGVEPPASFSNGSVTVVDRTAPHVVRVINRVDHLG